MFFRKGIVFIFGVVLTVWTAFGASFTQWESVVIDTAAVGSQFVAWTAVAVIAEQSWDLFAIWQSVSIDATVNGDVWWAGDAISINKVVNDDVRVAWRTVSINAPINWELFAAWNVIDINEAVSLPAMLAWELITVDGNIPAGSRIEWSTVIINVPLQWPLTINAEALSFWVEGSIEGAVMTNNESLTAILIGAWAEVSIKKDVYSSWNDEMWEKEHTSGFHFPWWSALSILFFSWLLVTLMPNYTNRAAVLIKSRPRQSLGWGTLFLIAAPIASLILLITFLWAPLAGALLAMWIITLVFLKVFVVAFGSALIWSVYPKTATSVWYKIATLILASVLIAVLPWFITFILWCFAVGAWAQNDMKLIREIA